MEFSFEDFCTFHDREEVCIEALISAKWPDGFLCPRCQHGHAFRIRTRKLPLFECSSCGRQTSPIAGTIMEGSRTPLSIWFRAVFLHSMPAGVSATDLSKLTGVTYKTAWLIGHKIRHAMTRSDESDLLSGLVRLTPAMYGRLCSSSAYREPHEHPLVVGVSLNESGEVNHLKIKQVSDAHIPAKWPGVPAKFHFLHNHVDVGASAVFSDIGRFFLEHFPWSKQIGKQAGRWLNSTFHGIGPKHLQAYLDQFAFRINQKFRKISVFESLLSWCAITPTITYSNIVSRPALIPAKRQPTWNRQIALSKAG